MGHMRVAVARLLEPFQASRCTGRQAGVCKPCAPQRARTRRAALRPSAPPPPAPPPPAPPPPPHPHLEPLDAARHQVHVVGGADEEEQAHPGKAHGLRNTAAGRTAGWRVSAARLATQAAWARRRPAVRVARRQQTQHTPQRTPRPGPCCVGRKSLAQGRHVTAHPTRPPACACAPSTACRW